MGTAAMAQRPDAVIFPKPTPTRLAVADFTPRTSANPETQSALSEFNKVVFDNLKFAAFFELPSKSFYPLKPLRSVQDVVFENWQVPTLDVDFLAFGTVQVDATATVVEAYLYDVKTRQQVLGKRFTITDTTLIRRVAHEFADQIVYELSAGASQGVARTQITFASLRGDSKEIWVMDYDGFNARQLTFNGGISKFPEWSSDNRKITYTTKLPTVNRWVLRIHELEGAESTVQTDGTYMSSPAFAPDGRLAFSARTSTSRDSDIFVAPPGATNFRNVTNYRGIDTAPTWSPTGTQIAFISDRSGSPQVWVMDADGSNVRRLVSEGGHCDSPDWSPDGRFIIYSWQAPTQWKHDVYLAEVASGKLYQLTSGRRGTNESPHWSPDGRHISFQSDRTGTKQIFIMNADGKNLRQVTAYGINESPSWGNYPQE
jgi:TolB protein